MVIVNLIVNIVKHQARDITRHALLEHVESLSILSPPSVDSAPPLAFVRAWPWVGVIFPESHQIPALCGQSPCPKPQWPGVTAGGQWRGDHWMTTSSSTSDTTYCGEALGDTRCGAENSTSWPKWLLFLGQQKIKKNAPKSSFNISVRAPATECSRTSRFYICSYKSFNWCACVIFPHEFANSSSHPKFHAAVSQRQGQCAIPSGVPIVLKATEPQTLRHVPTTTGIFHDQPHSRLDDMRLGTLQTHSDHHIGVRCTDNVRIPQVLGRNHLHLQCPGCAHVRVCRGEDAGAQETRLWAERS